jgi:predicted ester cyclase
MTSAEELVRRYVGVIDGSEDAAAVIEFIHPDFLDHVSGQRGTDIFAVVQRWGNETFADVAVEVHAIMTNADLVSIWFTTEATHIGNTFPILRGRPVTGRRLRWQAVHIFRLADGKLAEHWAVRDDLGLLRQIEPVVEVGGHAGAPATP